MECGAFAVGLSPGRAIAVVFQWDPMDVVVMGILVCYSGS